MSILHPGLALAALASVLVPILIHLLLRRRRRVIQWAAMDLLQRALQRDRRRQRVEQWLLLASRCLLLAAAGMALAQPILGEAFGSSGRPRTLWLVIDDGVASAERLPDGRSALERSVDEARRILEGLGSADRVGVVTAADPVRRSVDPPTADKARVESYLASLEPAWTGSNLATAISEVFDAVKSDDEQTSAEVILLSGFRRGTLDPNSPAPAADSALENRVRLQVSTPLTGAATNAWIASTEALRSGDDSGDERNRPLRVRMQRSSDALPRAVRRVTVSGGGAGAADALFDIGERRATTDVRLRQDAGPVSPASDGAANAGVRASADGSRVVVAIDEDAQPRDDRFFAILPTDEAPRVLVLDRRIFGAHGDLERLSSGAWMARATAPGRAGRLEVDEVDPGSFDRSMLSRVDAVIAARPDLLAPEAWPMLRRFVDDGGVLIVAPAPDDVGQQWVERFRSAIAPSWRISSDVERADTPWRLAAQQPTSATMRMLGSELSMLAAPVTVEQRLRMEAPAADAEVAIEFADGAPLILCGRPASSSRGWVALMGTAPVLSWTDLPIRPLMVPLMQELVRQGRRLATTTESMRVGSRAEAPRGATALLARSNTSDSVGTPAQSAARVDVSDDGRSASPILVPGIYDAVDGSNRVIGAIAVNVDHQRTSIEPNSTAAVMSWLETSGPWRWSGETDESFGSVGEIMSHGSWSFILLVLAGVTALAETVLGRVLSRSGVQERST